MLSLIHILLYKNTLDLNKAIQKISSYEQNKAEVLRREEARKQQEEERRRQEEINRAKAAEQETMAREAEKMCIRDSCIISIFRDPTFSEH